MRWFKLGYLIASVVVSVSCINKVGYEEKELDIGVPLHKFKLNISNLKSFINVKLLTDTTRNLISQLGNYKFSTSIDAANAMDNRYNPDVFIYYDYEGLQLKYVFKGAGLQKRNELQINFPEYKKWIYLETIIIEPRVYKGSLPDNISPYAKPVDVEKVLGKHNTFFDSGSSTTKVSYTYPEHGLRFLFNFYPDDVSPDSTMRFITVTDSVQEMKRFPTVYPEKK